MNPGHKLSKMRNRLRRLEKKIRTVAPDKKEQVTRRIDEIANALSR